MPLDPQAQAYVDQLKQFNIDWATLTVAQARGMAAQLMAIRPPGEPVARVEDCLIPGPGGELAIRIYTPQGAGPFPILVYFHTGGWTIANDQDPLCRKITNRAGCIVVAVDYRLAPEHPFPAAPEDCYVATKWTAEHAAEFGGDPARLAIGGSSAGGNMTAAVALLARERGGPKLAFQVPMFPVTDFRLDSPSMKELGEDFPPTSAQMRWIKQQYLPDEAAATNPLASPLLAPDLSGLPPALIITAEYDPLRDEGEAFGKRLQEAGIQAKVSCYTGLIHDFQDSFEEPGNRVVDEIAAALRIAFN
jgi:acetyl esterase